MVKPKKYVLDTFFLIGLETVFELAFGISKINNLW